MNVAWIAPGVQNEYWGEVWCSEFEERSSKALRALIDMFLVKRILAMHSMMLCRDSAVTNSVSLALQRSDAYQPLNNSHVVGELISMRVRPFPRENLPIVDIRDS
jgi:hypothetical protein